MDDHGGGLFLRGWLRDPLGLIGQLSLAGNFGEQPLHTSLLTRFPRPDLVKKYADSIPLGRLGTVDDVAAAVEYLASDGARYVTGALLPVDGGLGMGH